MNSQISFKNKIFLIISTDAFKLKQALDMVVSRLVKDKNDQKACVDIFYALDMDLEEFKQKLFDPSLNEVRIILIKNAQLIKKNIKDFLFENLEKLIETNYFVFEIDADSNMILKEKKFIEDKLFSFLLDKANIGKFFSNTLKKEFTTQDFIDSVYKKDYAKACYIVDSLFADKTKERQFGPLFLGILISQIPYIKDKTKKQKYLKYLFSADRAIKNEGITARLTLELLLCRLLES